MTAQGLGYLENQPGAEGDKPNQNKDTPDKDELGKKESAGHPDQVGGGYSSSKSSGPSRIRGLVGTRRRKFLFGGGIGAAIIAAIIAAFIGLLPLKILHIVQNLQNHFFASAQNATQKETDKLFSGYIRRSLKSCGGTIDRNCNPFPVGTNPVTKLYRGWRTAKLEDTIASNYGLEFKKVRGNYYMKVPGMTGDGAIITDFVDDKQLQLFSLDDYIANHASDPQWQHVNRSYIRQYVKDATANETRWKRVMYRFKVGRLLEEKYGIKRCIIFCKLTDPLRDNIQAQKTAAKMYLVERVLVPRNKTLAVVLLCILNPNCEPLNTQPSSTADTPCETNKTCELKGAPENKDTDMAIRVSLEDYAASLGIKDVAQLTALYKEIEDFGGLDKWLIKEFAEKVLNTTITKETAATIADRIPIVGWINMAAQLIETAKNAGPKIKKLSYITNAAAVVSLYAMYRTYADEVKSGKANAAEVGSFVSSLGPIAKDANLSDLKGGTAGAEQTPLYNSLLGAHTGTGSPNYKCDGKSSGPLGGSGLNLTCPEERLATGNDWANQLHAWLTEPKYGFFVLTKIADVWSSTIGAILKFLGGILGDFISFISSGVQQFLDAGCSINLFGVYVSPWAPYCYIRDLVKSSISKIISFATTHLFPNPFSQNMSGGRTFDLMASGADVSGNDFAHSGLGGQQLSDQQVAAIRSEQNQEELQSYKNQSLFARMFDTNSQYSPVTKLAMALPNSSDQAFSGFATLISNPFGRIFHSFSSIFSGGTALADTGSTGGDAFGVTQYGYPDGPIIIHSDPKFPGPMEGQDFWHVDHSDFWDAYCEPKNPDGSQNQNYIHYYDWWNQEAAATVDPNTGMPTNKTTNGCILIESTTGSAGAIYDQGLLTPDDLANSSTSSPPPPSGGTCGTVPTMNGYTPNANESKWLNYICQSVLSLLPNTPIQASALAGRDAWWSLKEGVLALDNPIGFSICGPSNQRIGMTDICNASTWQVGIAGVQVPNFSLQQVETTAQARHPGMSLSEILAQVSTSAGYPQGTPTYQKVISSTGDLLKSLLLRDPATGLTLVYGNIEPCTTSDWSINTWCGGSNPVAASQSIAGTAIQQLTAYFQGQ